MHLCETQKLEGKLSPPAALSSGKQHLGIVSQNATPSGSLTFSTKYKDPEKSVKGLGRAS